MKIFVWAVMMVLTCAASAQNSTAQKTAATDSDVKVLGLTFMPKNISQLEVVTVQNNTAVIPTAPSNMGAEYGKEPTRNSQYSQYQRRSQTLSYATLRLKNDGAKAIKSIVWEYTDPHFKGDKEIGYSEAKTKLKIPAGQTATLSARVPEHRDCGESVNVMGGVIAKARICGRETRKSTNYYYVEAKIKQVNYEDGTVWKAP